jgi:solute carrier family 25 (mitochondrial phosphate transporter), member 23/24/25/41
MSQISTVKAPSSSLADVRIPPAKERELLTVVKNLYSEIGIRGFYRGATPALIGIFPYVGTLSLIIGIDLAVFETLKTTYINSKYHTSEQVPMPIIMSMGMISGSCGALVCYPLSLIRTRLQAQGTLSHPIVYTNSSDVIRKTHTREGLRGFYKGLAPSLAKVLPAVSISYVVYEKAKHRLNIS